MTETNSMFIPMIRLLYKVSKEFEGKYLKVKKMTEVLLDEMPLY